MVGPRRWEAETVEREARDLGVNAIPIFADAGKGRGGAHRAPPCSPTLRDVLTGRIPTEIDPEMGEQRASAEFPWPALCDRETIPQSR